jgi:cytochrome c oxidase subunit 2
MNWTLSPATANMRDVATLWWTMFGVAAAVWLAVTIAVLVAIRRGRANGPATEAPYLGAESRRTRMALVGAGLATLGILLFFMGYDFVQGRRTPQHQHQGALTVTVQSHQWWWEFIYEDTVPGLRMATANELHVPVGIPVNLILESPDVIHSAWMPRLAGKADLVPGYTGSLVFTADTAGVYQGICAEFCGAQHANMRFLVIAEDRPAFDQWYASQRAPAAPPVDSTLVAGQRAFLSGSCATCHAIAGTPAAATNGPNLTHVASRRTLASGALPNTHDDMLRWIYNPQAIKPGTQMPPSNLPPESLQPLVAYLRSLK